MFLLRTVELHDDPELLSRDAALDATPFVYVAWEQIHAGRLAAHDAAPPVLRTWLSRATGPCSAPLRAQRPGNTTD